MIYVLLPNLAQKGGNVCVTHLHSIHVLALVMGGAICTTTPMEKIKNNDKC